MSIRNNGLGSRDLFMAGHFALKREMESFSSIATMTNRWRVFCNWAIKNGFKKMENIKHSDLIRYGEWLAELVDQEELSPATAQNYVSAANRVFQIARGDTAIWASPTTDCGIPERNGVAKINKAIPQEQHIAASAIIHPRVFTLLELQRVFGLRFEESCKLNAHRALAEALKKDTVTITAGTKGGRRRTVPVIDAIQINALNTATTIQDMDRSLIPRHQTYAEFQSFCYRESAKAGIRFHAERHAYAQTRYEQLTLAKCPVAAGIQHGRPHHNYLSTQLNISFDHAKHLDQQARQIIALELGHNRSEITNAYLG